MTTTTSPSSIKLPPFELDVIAKRGDLFLARSGVIEWLYGVRHSFDPGDIVEVDQLVDALIEQLNLVRRV